VLGRKIGDSGIVWAPTAKLVKTPNLDFFFNEFHHLSAYNWSRLERGVEVFKSLLGILEWKEKL